MRIETPSFFGMSMPQRLTFSKAERATLARAAAIITAADDLLQANGVDPDDYDTRSDFVNGWDICRRFAGDDPVYLS